ncbi:class I SAM-dependent methyltransferase [Chlamydiota bacterium]
MKFPHKKAFKKSFNEIISTQEGQQYGLDNYGRYFDTCTSIAHLIKKDAKMIDFGIYPGHLSLLIKHIFGVEITGISTTLTDTFSQNMADEHIPLLNIDLEKQKTPFTDNTFDYVLGSEIIEHLYFPLNFLKEAFRTLKPGGFLIVTTPNLPRLKNRLNLFFRGKSVNPHLHGNEIVFSNNDWTHKREYTGAEVVKMLEALGFKTCSIKYTPLLHYPNSFKKKIKNITKKAIYLFPAWKGGLICIGKKPEK